MMCYFWGLHRWLFFWLGERTPHNMCIHNGDTQPSKMQEETFNCCSVKVAQCFWQILRFKVSLFFSIKCSHLNIWNVFSIYEICKLLHSVFSYILRSNPTFLALGLHINTMTSHIVQFSFIWPWLKNSHHALTPGMSSAVLQSRIHFHTHISLCVCTHCYCFYTHFTTNNILLLCWCISHLNRLYNINISFTLVLLPFTWN